ncbi:MAG TPA: hypothetical protein VMX13_00405 [Sedimentisphaerales bacterium]|nr:hypothetical protein [Sedimentisphaerales bacterium]
MVDSKTEITWREVWKRIKWRFGDKRNRRKLYWLLFHLAAVVILLGLLLYTPGRYKPVAQANSRNMSKYLTHELAPTFYNGAQKGRPFDLPVTQEGINDIIAHSGWPRQYGETSFCEPAVLFEPDGIVLMGTVDMRGVEFVVTIVLEPQLNDMGLLNLRVGKVKVGAMNVTFPARIIAKRMYEQRVGAAPVDFRDIRTQIAASLLNDEPFEPVFKAEDKYVRLEKITLEKEKLTLRLVPISD